MSKELELSPRLQMVADLVPPCTCLADVGTDHAYLPAALILKKKISCAIAADLRQGPLSRAKATAMEWGLSEQIAPRLCDGLAGIHPDEVGAVVIAGMGGETIAGILAQAPWTRKGDVPLILQPMSSMPELRSWLADHDYQIITEELTQERNTLYTAFLVRPGKMASMTLTQLWVGHNRPHPLREAWLDHWFAKTTRALEGLAQAIQESAMSQKRMLEQLQLGLVEMKQELSTWQR